MATKQINSCVKSENDGVFMEIEKESSHTDISFFSNFEFSVSVCLRNIPKDDGLSEMINALQSQESTEVVKIDCCFENEHDGIYLEVKNKETYREISFYKDFKYQGSVCLKGEELIDVIHLLQSFKK